MTRQEFLKACSLLGLGTAILPSALTSCETVDDGPIDVQFKGKVLVIGAGSAGLMAAYTLQRYGIDFEVLEASAVYGGRVKKTSDFADFPIDLGAEWVHDTPSVFSRLIDDETVDGSIDLVSYNPETFYAWTNGRLDRRNWQSPFYGEHKFSNSTWYDFFATYIVPSITEKIRYNQPVTEIDYSGDQVVVLTEGGISYSADKLLVTVPTTILKSDSITFTPTLPTEKQEALKTMYVPEGIKVFMEFSERFYPDIVTVADGAGAASDQKIFYDAAFKKDSEKNILALFNVGPSAALYTNESDDEILKIILGELDAMFDGKATKYYLKHVIQNWSAEPYIKGSYTHFHESENNSVEIMKKPMDNKVYFAGEALHEYAGATVQGAGLSAKTTIEDILQTA